MRMKSIFATSILVAGVVGCSTITTEKYAEPKTKNPILGIGDDGRGIVYFLPKRNAKFTLSSEVLPGKTKATLAQTREAIRQKKSEFDTKSGEAKLQSDIADQLKKLGDGDGEKKARGLAIVARAEAGVISDAIAALRKTETTLVSRLGNPQTIDDCDKAKYSVEVKLLPLEPDYTQRYTAVLKHSPLRDDEQKLTTTPEGLLTTSTITATDRTTDIILDLVSAVAAFGVSPTAVLKGIQGAAPKAAKCQPVAAFRVEKVFDPSDANKALSWSLINTELNGRTPFEIDVKALHKAESYEFSPDGNKIARGLLYRRAIPYLIEIAKQDPNDSKKYIPEQSSVFHVPNAGPIGLISFDAGIGVTTKRSVEFENGMLVSVDGTRPSELASIVRLPVAIAKSLISVPAELLQLKLDYTKDETELAKSVNELETAVQVLHDEREARAAMSSQAQDTAQN